METLILYCSKSNGNTKKLVDAIVEAHPEVDTLDATTVKDDREVDFSKYQLIGLASGVYRGKPDMSVREIASDRLREGDFAFGLMTYGMNNSEYTQILANLCREKKATLIGVYGCQGYGTYLPLRFMADELKGHPDEEDVQGAVDFYDELLSRYGDMIVEQRAARDERDAYKAAHPKKTIGSSVAGAVKKAAGKLGKKD